MECEVFLEYVIQYLATAAIWGIITMPIWGLILGIISLCTEYTPEEVNAMFNESEQKLKRRLSWKRQVETYDNPSNITDDAFLLFVGEQKLTHGHPESIISDGEEW